MMNFVRKLRLEQFHRDIVILPYSGSGREEKLRCRKHPEIRLSGKSACSVFRKVVSGTGFSV